MSNFHKNSKQLERINAEGLKRLDLTKDLQFLEINNNLETQKKLFNYVIDKANDFNDYVALVDNALLLFVSSCNQIENFKLKEDETPVNAKQNKKNIIDGFNKQEASFNQNILPIINHVKIQGDLNGDKLQQITTEFESQIAKNILRLDNSVENSKQELIQIKKIKTEAESFARGELVKKYGNIFETQAMIHKKTAVWSAVLFVVFFIVGILFISAFFNDLTDSIKNSTLEGNKLNLWYVTQFTYKTLIISLAYIGLRETLKNFRINMHLYNINKHRQNSLLSFTTLINSAIDTPTKSTIATKVSETIYSVGQIGYLEENKKGIALTSQQIIDLIKNIR